MIKPYALGPGSNLQFVAPASSPDPYKLQRGARRMRELGFNISFGPLVRNLRTRGYLAGTDQERAASLMNAFQDPDVDGIVCAAGGYGTLRLLNCLDYDIIAANPKPIIGYSDVTALHTAIGQRAGLVTFHGPMGSIDSDDHFNVYTRENFRRALTLTEPLGEIANPEDGRIVQTVSPGRAKGPLTGGNLSLVCATLGTPWEIDTKGKILLLEDWREPPFTIDTYLTQLKLAGKFEDAVGVILGEFIQILPDDGPHNHSVDEVIQEVMGDIGRPVVYGLASGHGRQLVTLPLGVECEIDGDSTSVAMTEVALRASPSRKHHEAPPKSR